MDVQAVKSSASGVDGKRTMTINPSDVTSVVEQQGSKLGVGTIFGYQTDNSRVKNNLKFLDDTQSTTTREPMAEKPADPSAAKPSPKLGTLMGVYVPCMQNILGAILYLRLSWIVGQAGVGMTLIIVLMCCCTTFLTSLSLSAIATNGAIKAGGPYYLISRALGPEFGGSVGLCFYVGTTIAAALYVLGAVEVIKDSIQDLVIVGASGRGNMTDLEIQCGECQRQNTSDFAVLGIIVLIACTAVVFGGVKYVSKVAPFVLIPVLLSVALIWLGIWTASARDISPSTGITSHWDFSKTFSPAWGADLQCLVLRDDNGKPLFTEDDLPPFDFYQALALYFPSVTGIMAGSNRSGDLRNAQHSIPLGTLAAVLTTSAIYVLTVIFYGGVAERENALGQAFGLKTNYLLSADVSLQATITRIGIIMSSLGAALQSLTGAPRLLQAIANDNLMPILKHFQGTGEPRKPLLLTFIICLGCVATGNINVIAPLITMFFLMCYSAVNLCVLLMDLMREPNWRPRFKYYHMSTALAGLCLCLFIMFSTSFIIAIVACCVVALIYKYIEFQKVKVQWGDGTRGLRYQRARQALLQLEKLTTVHVKNWRPQVLLFAKIQADGEMHQPGLLKFLGELKGARGISIISTAIEGNLITQAHEQMEIERKLRQHRDANHIRGFTQVVMSNDISTALDSLLQTAGLGGFCPNTVVTAWPTSWKTNIKGAERMMQILTSAHAMNMAKILIKGHESWPKSLPKLSTIDIWWVVHDGGLLLLLSIILRKHKKWANCLLRVFVVCNSQDKPDKLAKKISTFLYNMRINARLKVVQLTDEGGISALLPSRGADWGDDAENAKLGSIVPNSMSMMEQSSVYDDLDDTDHGERSRDVSVKRPKPPAAEFRQDVDPKFRTTYAFNQMVRKFSSDAALVLCNLPLPSENKTTEMYMQHLEIMMEAIPHALLVAGQKDEAVITMYS
ncbi:hypothetical protein AB1Y20_006925 [Prymnesium parvum]|uniref:Solute carrier family 12 member 2 n=1 Tax=Prymnesium parvum TaxID=97485 RepID=A0AB34IZT7_PRYPA